MFKKIYLWEQSKRCYQKNLNFSKRISMTDNILNKIIAESSIKNKPLITSAIQSLLQIDKEAKDVSDIRLIETTISEILQSMRVFQDFRHIRKACIFGSARTPENHPNFKLAEALAKALCKQQYMIITGGGPGIMAAGNKGAPKNKSFGLNIVLPFEQFANPYILNNPKHIDYKYFYTRKLIFIKESDATILFPGGFGTHDEGFELLTLIQTGRCAPRPIVLFSHDKSNYWERWIGYIKTQLLDRHYIANEDMQLFSLVHTVKEATKLITQFYTIYHSIRYIDNQAILRLNKSLSSTTMDTIIKRFAHISPKVDFKCTHVSNSKEDNTIYPEKPRLIFDFNMTSYGDITNLIHTITQLELEL